MDNPEGGKTREKDESVVKISSSALYGMVIVVLVALLTLSVLTKGFGLMPCASANCPEGEECPVCPAGNGTTCEPADPYQGISELSVATGDLPPLGDSGAVVNIIEVSDYQCPYCSMFYANTEAPLLTNYVNAGKVKLYFRDYPLSFHAHAMDAAVAARCADDQGKFWEMHGKLFESQSEWSGSSDVATLFAGYAGGLGMDTTAFSSCYAARTAEAEISSDMSSAATSGVKGTPGTFVVIPKSEVDVTALRDAVDSVNTKYGSVVVKLYQDNDNLILFVSGALPYDVFDSVLKTVSF